MLDKQRYFDEKRVKRETIAMDIRFQKISHDDLMNIINDPDISSAFYGTIYRDKVPKSQWDDKYLEKLTSAVVSEGFNKDYLLYLEEVTSAVMKNKNKYKRAIAGIVLVIAIIALVVVIGNLI